jgi:hypothetical protein
LERREDTPGEARRHKAQRDSEVGLGFVGQRMNVLPSIQCSHMGLKISGIIYRRVTCGHVLGRCHPQRVCRVQTHIRRHLGTRFAFSSWASAMPATEASGLAHSARTWALRATSWRRWVSRLESSMVSTYGQVTELQGRASILNRSRRPWWSGKPRSPRGRFPNRSPNPPCRRTALRATGWRAD